MMHGGNWKFITKGTEKRQITGIITPSEFI
jgi:hypothetical protein